MQYLSQLAASWQPRACTARQAARAQHGECALRSRRGDPPWPLLLPSWDLLRRAEVRGVWGPASGVVWPDCVMALQSWPAHAARTSGESTNTSAHVLEPGRPHACLAGDAQYRQCACMQAAAGVWQGVPGGNRDEARLGREPGTGRASERDWEELVVSPPQPSRSGQEPAAPKPPGTSMAITMPARQPGSVQAQAVVPSRPDITRRMQVRADVSTCCCALTQGCAGALQTTCSSSAQMPYWGESSVLCSSSAWAPT